MRCYAGCGVGCYATRFGGIDGIASLLLVSDLDDGDAFCCLKTDGSSTRQQGEEGAHASGGPLPSAGKGALRYGPAVFLPGNGLSGDGDGGGL